MVFNSDSGAVSSFCLKLVFTDLLFISYCADEPSLVCWETKARPLILNGATVLLVLLFSRFTCCCSDCPSHFFFPFNLLLILNASAVHGGSVNRGVIMGFQNNRWERRPKLVFLRVTLWHKHACLLGYIFISVHVMICDCAIPTGNPEQLRVAFPGVVCGLVSY